VGQHCLRIPLAVVCSFLVALVASSSSASRALLSARRGDRGGRWVRERVTCSVAHVTQQRARGAVGVGKPLAATDDNALRARVQLARGRARPNHSLASDLSVGHYTLTEQALANVDSQPLATRPFGLARRASRVLARCARRRRVVQRRIDDARS